MRRSRLALAAVVAATIGVLVWWLSGQLDGDPGTAHDWRARAPTADERTGDRGASRTSTPSAIDPDPVGSLRLEGQVIDEREQPVGGATVTIKTEPPRTTTTEADGSFAFDDLLPQTYVLVARQASRRAGPVGVRVRDGTEPVILRVRRGNTIAVTVIDGETKTPIAAARVRNRAQEVLTDSAGIAVLEGLDSWFTSIEASAEGYAAGKMHGTVPLDPDGRIDWTIELVRGLSVAGTVIRPDGARIADAVISMQGTGYWERVASDSDGGWKVPGAGVGRYTIVAEARGFARSAPVEITIVDGIAVPSVELRLRDGVTIAGVVVDANDAPVPGARVVLQAGTYSPRGTTSGQDGRFEVRGLETEPYQIMASADERSSEIVTASAPATELRLTLAPATIEGIVVDSSGQPVPEAEVRATGPARGWQMAIADAGGRFVIGPMVLGDYALEASMPGTGLSDKDVRRPGEGDVVHATTGARDVKVTLPAAGAISGVVLADGRPVAHYGYVISHFVAGLLSFATPTVVRSPDGRFTREGVPPGTWYIAVVGDGFARTIVHDIHVVAGETTDIGTITPGAGSSISGVVRDDGGTPVAGAKVTIAGLIQEDRPGNYEHPFDRLKSGTHVAISGADGRFTVDRVADPRSELRAAATHHSRRSQEIAVPAEGDVVLVLVGTGAIEGVVAGTFEHFSVTAMPLEDTTGSGRTASVDQTGRFRLEDVTPGRYRVRASEGPRIVSLPVEVEVRSRETARVELSPGGITLAVELGTRTCSYLGLTPGENNADYRQTSSLHCRDAPTFLSLAPGPHYLCVDETCRTITIASTPERQTIDVSDW